MWLMLCTLGCMLGTCTYIFDDLKRITPESAQKCCAYWLYGSFMLAIMGESRRVFYFIFLILWCRGPVVPGGRPHTVSGNVIGALRKGQRLRKCSPPAPHPHPHL